MYIIVMIIDTYCGNPGNIDNGKIETVTGIFYGHNVTYICDGGFTLSNNPGVQCLETGMWSTLPTCTCKKVIYSEASLIRIIHISGHMFGNQL